MANSAILTQTDKIQTAQCTRKIAWKRAHIIFSRARFVLKIDFTQKTLHAPQFQIQTSGIMNFCPYLWLQQKKNSSTNVKIAISNNTQWKLGSSGPKEQPRQTYTGCRTKVTRPPTTIWLNKTNLTARMNFLRSSCKHGKNTLFRQISGTLTCKAHN